MKIWQKLSKFLPLFFLIIFTFLVFKPFFLEGKLPIPADTIVGMYHPWKDTFGNLPFKNFQITDPVRQQFPWRESSIDLIKKGQMPSWNPYSFSGTPLLANLQSASFYPLNILYWLLSFSFAWSLQIVLQLVLGGLFMIWYLKNLKLEKLAVILGTLSWIGSGFFIAWLEWNTTVQTAIWIPLLLLSIDKVFLNKKKIFWSAVFLFSLCSSLLAGYLQPFFYVFLLINAYLIFKLIQTKQYKLIILFPILYILFSVVTFPQWFETFKFIGLSARDVDQVNWQRPDWFLPWQNLVQFIAPDYYGNPATLNYFGVWNYQEFVGYVGIVGTIFALLAIIAVKETTSRFFVGLLIFALIFVLPTPLGKLPFQLNIPFLSTAQPSRLIMIVDFCLAVLASFGLDYFLKNRPKTKNISFVFIIIIISLWVVAFITNNQIGLRNLVLPTVLVILTMILISRQKSVWLLGIILLFDLTRFAIKFESFSDKKWLYPPTIVTNFLQEKSKNDVFRIAAVDDRIMPPNFNVAYRLQMISGYDPLYLKRYGEFIAALERGKPDISTPWGFNRIITPKNFESRLFDLLGVKYLLSLNEIESSKYFLALQEGNTKVYENKQVFPRAFFVNNIIGVSNKQAAIEKMFSQDFDFKKTAVLEENIYWENFETGEVNILKYSENEVVFETDNKGTGYLVFNDVYYPNWKVEIDGIPAKIFITNYTFRGVITPAGKHRIRFYFL